MTGNRYHRWWTRERAVAHLKGIGERRALNAKHPTPTMADMIPHHNTFVSLFGSVCGAQVAAGFEPNVVGRPRGR